VNGTVTLALKSATNSRRLIASPEAQVLGPVERQTSTRTAVQVRAVEVAGEVAVGSIATEAWASDVRYASISDQSFAASRLVARGHIRKLFFEDDGEFSELSRVFQFEIHSSNLCAEGLNWIASANHATDCFAAASAASFEE
jgi:hypothetical protein